MKKESFMADPAIKLFGKTIPLPELAVVVDSCSSYTGVLTETQDQNLVRLSDSCTGDDDDEMGGSSLGGGDDDVGDGSRVGGESESDKKVSFFFFWICELLLKITHDLLNGND